MAVKISRLESTRSEDRDLPRTIDIKRRQDRDMARAHRARKKLRARFHPIPVLMAVEVDGKRGYWRAIHSNGLVQTVFGSHTEAARKVAVIVDKLNAFEVWCRRTPKKQRVELL